MLYLQDYSCIVMINYYGICGLYKAALSGIVSKIAGIGNLMEV